MDFMGVGGGGGGGGSPDGGSEERVRLVRPIPSGGHARRSPAPERGREGGHPFSSQGLHGELVWLFLVLSLGFRTYISRKYIRGGGGESRASVRAPSLMLLGEWLFGGRSTQNVVWLV